MFSNGMYKYTRVYTIAPRISGARLVFTGCCETRFQFGRAHEFFLYFFNGAKKGWLSTDCVRIAGEW